MKRKRSPKEVRKIMYSIRSGLLVISVGLIIVFIYEFYLVDFKFSEMFGERRFGRNGRHGVISRVLNPKAWSDNYRILCGMFGFYGLYYYQYKFTAKKIEESFNKNNNPKP